MTFYKKFQINTETQLYVWKITETLSELQTASVLADRSINRLNGMKSESHQKGFLAVRQLLQHLNYSDFDLIYDATGKPKLTKNENLHISISHSHEFSVIGISTKPIGIDLEKQRKKILTIASKFSTQELSQNDEQKNIRKLTVTWGIKEAIFKIENKVGISFIDHITENSFSLKNKTGTAKLNFLSLTKQFDFYFEEFEDYTLVCVHNQNS
ncbi:MAG: 4'-phosphopantetheinyl transferase [Flavobacterium sp.]|jgi:4'-phosphopantetheinyl transferase